jgi:hypothetical protein
MSESEPVPAIGEILEASRSPGGDGFERAEVLEKHPHPSLGTLLEVRFIADGHRLEIAWPSPVVRRQ